MCTFSGATAQRRNPGQTLVLISAVPPGLLAEVEISGQGSATW